MYHREKNTLNKHHMVVSFLFCSYSKMGLLTEGQALTWKEIQSVLKQLQTYALEQLIRIYKKYQHRQGDAFTWGDEVKKPTQSRVRKISLNSSFFLRSN